MVLTLKCPTFESINLCRAHRKILMIPIDSLSIIGLKKNVQWIMQFTFQCPFAKEKFCMKGNVPSTYTRILLPIQRSQQCLLALTMGKAHMWTIFSKCEVLNYHNIGSSSHLGSYLTFCSNVLSFQFFCFFHLVAPFIVQVIG